jgi:hypothetical protein
VFGQIAHLETVQQPFVFVGHPLAPQPLALSSVGRR